jgi:hypothetical protein
VTSTSSRGKYTVITRVGVKDCYRDTSCCCASREKTGESSKRARNPFRKGGQGEGQRTILDRVTFEGLISCRKGDLHHLQGRKNFIRHKVHQVYLRKKVKAKFRVKVNFYFGLRRELLDSHIKIVWLSQKCQQLKKKKEKKRKKTQHGISLANDVIVKVKLNFGPSV